SGSFQISQAPTLPRKCFAAQRANRAKSAERVGGVVVPRPPFAQAGVEESRPRTLIPFARAMFTQRSASRTCHGLMGPRLGWSESQAKSIRTERTPAAAIFAITSRRVASVYWLHVQWN